MRGIAVNGVSYYGANRFSTVKADAKNNKMSSNLGYRASGAHECLANFGKASISFGKTQNQQEVRDRLKKQHIIIKECGDNKTVLDTCEYTQGIFHLNIQDLLALNVTEIKGDVTIESAGEIGKDITVNGLEKVEGFLRIDSFKKLGGSSKAPKVSFPNLNSVESLEISRCDCDIDLSSLDSSSIQGNIVRRRDCSPDCKISLMGQQY